MSHEAVEAIEALADDYLRLVSRTRPWDRRAHEEALEAFLRWVREVGREGSGRAG